MLCRISLMLLVSVAISSLSPAGAADMNIVGPPGSVYFGTHVAVLPNGNIVVTDPNGPVANFGAVYLYSPNGTLISTLTGGSSGDSVGNGGIQVLPNGNFLVKSKSWRNPATDATGAGALTWVNGTTGLSGVVSDGNSLVGTKSGDLSSSNTIVVVVLSNGNYVVQAPSWDNGPVEGAGAVIWGNANVGISGPVTTSNALYGTQAYDQVGFSAVVPLSNGNYVVASAYWDNGAISDAGAATWVDGSSGLVGAVSSANSLVGTNTSDAVGIRGITALSNGNYVVSSYSWNNGAIARAGAATWANGTTGLIDVVTSANSLVGSSADDHVGRNVIALDNGNYVVASPMWKNGASPKAGAATWGDGSSGVRGTISASNSLVGASANDGELNNTQFSPVPVALSNGNYVVVNPGWNNGAVVDVGAVTWGNGASGRTGFISAANSLIGSTAGDAVGAGETIALVNGNYVVASDLWRRDATPRVGAATWGNGASGLVGVVSTANSLIGSAVGDGYRRNMIALDNGNYVVASSYWDHGAIADVGAVTRCNGTSGRVSVISPANSLIGSSVGDHYGEEVLALANGDYIAASYYWDHGGAADAGAFTHVDGSAGLSGVPSATNSIVGSIAADLVSAGTRATLGANHYAVISARWTNGGIVKAGAVTILPNTARTRGLPSPANSILGTTASQGTGLNVAYDPVLDRAVVGRPGDNIVTVRALSLFADGFE